MELARVWLCSANMQCTTYPSIQINCMHSLTGSTELQSIVLQPDVFWYPSSICLKLFDSSLQKSIKIWNNPAFQSSLMFKRLYLVLLIQRKGGEDPPPELSWLTLSPLPSLLLPTTLTVFHTGVYCVLPDHSMPYLVILCHTLSTL